MFDLMVEYHLDYYYEHPLEVHATADGGYQFTDTGDALIDKWEQEIADGNEENIDLTEAFSPESLAKVQRLLAKAKGQQIGAAYGKQTASMADTVDRIERVAKQQGLFNPGSYGTPRR